MAVLKLGDKLAFVGLAAVAEEFERVGLADVGAFDFLLLLGEFKHTLLDFGEFGGGERVLAWVDVVVEPVFDGGADAELHPRIKLLKSFGEEVG